MLVCLAQLLGVLLHVSLVVYRIEKEYGVRALSSVGLHDASQQFLSLVQRRANTRNLYELRIIVLPCYIPY